MKNSVACCYLTHNHSKIMDQVLDRICLDYEKHGIDIYIYDSSTNDETKDVVSKYNKQGFNHLYYIDVRFITSADKKYLYVIQGNGLLKHYDYIWPTKDRCFFRGNALDDICFNIEKDCDVVFAVDEEDRCQLYAPNIKDEYTDAVEFFEHYGQLSTNWEALIRRTSTMLDPINWDDYISKYHLGKDNNFNQTISLYARLAEMNDIKIRVIHCASNDRLESSFSTSGWKNKVYDIWVDRWIPAIYGLPSIYDKHKASIIKAQTNLPVIMGTTDAFIEQKQSGALTIQRLEAIRSLWNMLSTVPIEYAEMILNNNEESMYQLVADSFVLAFAQKDYEKAYNIFSQNIWLKNAIPMQDYNDLELCFSIFKSEINQKGYSLLFEGTYSIDSLLEKIRNLKRKH